MIATSDTVYITVYICSLVTFTIIFYLITFQHLIQLCIHAYNLEQRYEHCYRYSRTRQKLTPPSGNQTRQLQTCSRVLYEQTRRVPLPPLASRSSPACLDLRSNRAGLCERNNGRSLIDIRDVTQEQIVGSNSGGRGSIWREAASPGGRQFPEEINRNRLIRSLKRGADFVNRLNADFIIRRDVTRDFTKSRHGMTQCGRGVVGGGGQS